ncbi:hypothetical protein QUF72_07615 [Desulfobacterales bacterium HSG2]|nr:hypothetical protein [Desulfobacterales bacterium HSG2]
MNRENDTEEIIVDVTEEEYKNDLARGLHEDEVMKAGRHKFRRGGFLSRHGVTSAPAKIRISVDIDPDILSYFKERASDADLYEAEFNDILRELIETEKNLSASGEIRHS